MQQEKTVEYKDQLDAIIERTIRFNDSQGHVVILGADATRRQYAPTATDAEWEQFKDTIEANGLDPRRKEVYFQKYETKDGSRVSIVTSYLVYSARAFKSGKIKSISAPKVLKPKPEMDSWIGEIEIERTDIEGKITWQTPMKEVNKHQSIWNIMPEFMLKKNTFAQGLRFYLPDVIGGLPYLQEEITSGMSETDISESNIPIENKIEPSTEEQANLEEEKQKALDSISDKISGFDTIEKLDAWVKKQTKLEASTLRNDILKMIEDRRQALTPQREPKVNRTEQINKIVAITNEKVADVNSYVSDEMLASDTMILELLAGNAEAVPDFKRNLHEYLQSVNDQPEATYEQQPE